jgi:hypothetical protein
VQRVEQDQLDAVGQQAPKVNPGLLDIKGTLDIQAIRGQQVFKAYLERLC